jgi:hypothetical protein
LREVGWHRLPTLHRFFLNPIPFLLRSFVSLVIFFSSILFFSLLFLYLHFHTFLVIYRSLLSFTPSPLWSASALRFPGLLLFHTTFLHFPTFGSKRLLPLFSRLFDVTALAHFISIQSIPLGSFVLPLSETFSNPSVIKTWIPNLLHLLCWSVGFLSFHPSSPPPIKSRYPSQFQSAYSARPTTDSIPQQQQNDDFQLIRQNQTWTQRPFLCVLRIRPSHQYHKRLPSNNLFPPRTTRLR